MAPKKKSSGDPSKGEMIFKNLCSTCHSLSVSINTRSAALGVFFQGEAIFLSPFW